MGISLSTLSDIQEIKDLALRYAKAVDSRDAEKQAGVFVEDGLIDGSGYLIEGRASILKIAPMMAKRYKATFHAVQNHLIELDGDEATGEVYALSHHLSAGEDGSLTDWVMVMRYLDRYVRVAGSWLFAHRHIIVDWTETRQADAFPAST